MVEPAAARRRPALLHADGRWRCAWCGTDPLYVHYHDTEWGVPVHDDQRHFEFLILEGAQAGLSWRAVLQRREGYRQAFAGFDPAKVARFTSARIEKLLLGKTANGGPKRLVGAKKPVTW